MCPHTREEFLTTGIMDVDTDVGCSHSEHFGMCK